MKAYVEAHKKATGKAPDAWASPVTYATYQILEQAIEAVGSKDRKAVTAYIKRHTFKTVIGPVAYKNQNNDHYWTVGQWQGGQFVGVASTGRAGEKPAVVKAGW